MFVFYFALQVPYRLFLDVARSDTKLVSSLPPYYEYLLTVHTLEVELSSELLHTMDDSYEGVDWESFNDMTLSDSDSGNESVFEAAAEDCLRGMPVLGPPETNLSSGYHQKAKKAAYVVFNGRKIGVFQTW